MMGMKKDTIVFRVDKELMQQIRTTAKQQKITNSQVIRDALQQYYTGTQPYNLDLVTELRQHITELQQDKERLQQRVDYLMLPWYKRILIRPQLKEKN